MAKKSKTAQKSGKKFAREALPKRRQGGSPITRYNPINRPPGDAGSEVGRGTLPPPGSGGPPPTSQPPTPPPTPDPNPFAWMGLPPDVAATAAELLKSDGTGDSAMAYIRTTPWYAQEFAGIADFVKNGKIHDVNNPEHEYQAMKSNISGSYQRYYGRLPTSQEIASIAAAGWDDGIVDKKGQGYAYVQANVGEIQYLTGAFGGGQLSADELQSYGEQQSGLTSTLGASIESKVRTAMAKVERVFSGQQSTSAALENSLGNITKQRSQLDIGA